MTDDSAYVRAYARALLGAARSSATLPAVQRDLAAVMGALADSVELRRWICKRVIGSPARRTAEAEQRLAKLVSPMTLRLLLRMSAWNHLHLLPSVVKRFDLAVRKLENRRTASVATGGRPDSPDVGTILRTVFWHSLALATLMGIVVMLQAYVFKWMIPSQ